MNKAKIIPLLIVVAALVVLGATAYHFYTKYQATQALLNDPAKVTAKEIETLVAKVGKLMQLPSDEQPTVATVVDASRLKDQPFFAKAENNDKVLLYSKNQKAILYRPKDNKIIEVAPINIGAANVTPSPAAEVTPTAPFDSAQGKTNLALYNGTETTGLTFTLESRLNQKFGNLKVLLKDNAVKKDYEKTLVVVLNPDKQELAQKIATELKAEIGQLPEGEKSPVAETGETIDILIIVGKDFQP